MGRRTVDLSIPEAISYPSSIETVSIGEVRDNRKFENKPKNPSIPSIDGDVSLMSPDTKAMMIGRQRNTYGMAMGDIALPHGKSVEFITKALLTESLKRYGYSVINSPSSDKSISVDINEFWAWFTPGMFSVSFEARVYCTLVVKQKSDFKTIMIHGYGINTGQVASDANWQLAYQRAFEDFLNKSTPELKKAGL